MRYKTAIPMLVFCLMSIYTSAQYIDVFEQINKDVWYRFYAAYDSLDYTISEAIHTSDVMRIPANQGQIIDYKSYMNGIKTSFEHAREKGETRSISLRFFERLANDSIASERGIYKFTLNKGNQDERNYYGQFHVLLVNRNGKWKILMDYDSNENNTIGEEDYQSAHAIDDFNWIEERQ